MWNLGENMCRILIAEDELIERMVLKKTLLKRFGDCEILEAKNGREALHIFQDRGIDVAILDIEMPGIKGIEVAERMRQERADIPIIFLTAYEKFEYAKKAVSVGALEYLLKPYSEREIITTVDVAVKRCGHKEEAHGVTDRSEDKQFISQGNVTDENINRLRVMVTMVEEYIKSNYMLDISMQDAAQAVNYSETYFCKMFKQQYGQSFTAYLTNYRIEEAKKLLLQPTVNVKCVGERVGYIDSNYFARVFRRNTGMSPSEYRNAFLKSIS